MPKCGRETEVFSRVVGYHRPIKNWNLGQQAQFKDRRKYSIGKIMEGIAARPDPALTKPVGSWTEEAKAAAREAVGV